MTKYYFLNAIQTLRQQEEVILYERLLHISEQEKNEVAAFLYQEYQHESLEYPYQIPEFDAEAALWAAQFLYISIQLVLYREHKENDLANLLPDFPNAITSSAILSADLCLRFLPDVLIQLRLIDSEDSLIEMLETQLSRWHYSGINYTLPLDSLDFHTIAANPCLHQLYINRIITHKKIHLSQHPVFKEAISANFGLFAQEFWNDFKIANSLHE